MDKKIKIIKAKCSTKSRKDQCLWCHTKNTIIDAHSIQKSLLQNIIDGNGELMSAHNPKKPYVKEVRIEKIKQGSFSIFRGMCKKHDNDIFEPLEKGNLYKETPEQNYLLAFRSLCKEYYAHKQHVRYNKCLEDEGLRPEDENTRQGVENTKISCKNLKQEFEKMKCDIEKKYFDDLCTQVFTLDAEYKVVANSNFFPYKRLTDDGDVFSKEEEERINSGELQPSVFFNVFPQNGKTYFVFSCFTEMKQYLKDFLSQIDSQNDNFTQLITMCIIQYVENFGISVEMYNSLGLDKQKKLQKYFNSNLLDPNKFDTRSFLKDEFSIF